MCKYSQNGMIIILNFCSTYEFKLSTLYKKVMTLASFTGFNKMLSMIKKNFFLPGLYKDSTYWVVAQWSVTLGK